MSTSFFYELNKQSESVNNDNVIGHESTASGEVHPLELRDLPTDVLFNIFKYTGPVSVLIISRPLKTHF